MTPDEQEAVFSVAQIVFFNTVNLIVTVTGYGAFVLGTIIAVVSLRRRTWGRSQTILLVCLLVIFTCFTWDVFYSGGFNVTDIRYTFVKTSPEGLVAQIEAADRKTLVWQYMPSWAATVNLLLSDCIVVWRAWILFQDEKFWKISLAVLMIANIGVNVADCIWGNIELSVEIASSTTLDWLSSIISLTVNIFATFLIAFKAWNHHRFMAAVSIRKRTRSESILLLLIESGAIYCGIQSVYAVFILLDVYTVVDIGFSQAMNVITAMSIVAAACYPIAVIILVHNENSLITEIETFQESSCAKTVDESHSMGTLVLSNT
ncbi:hypothetical protein C8J55DRAFT_506762 [Lentinula edodes]|uniref:Uncharacterized protein n=1 Tax=Lentinula lateritia TaxID=40482 RepID=A0A9W9ARK7_9AGAR|nr:hypothetical protein C8J55DRAFT_506762 [Lentinula edodes]